jgi:hypothetical protein
VGGCKADLREIRYESMDWVELNQCGADGVGLLLTVLEAGIFSSA